MTRAAAVERCVAGGAEVEEDAAVFGEDGGGVVGEVGLEGGDDLLGGLGRVGGGHGGFWMSGPFWGEQTNAGTTADSLRE